MADIKRRKNESFEAFFRRVKRDWMNSGQILQAKKIQYFTKEKSKNVRKAQTVGKAKKQSKTAYLQKVGKLPVPKYNGKRTR